MSMTPSIDVAGARVTDDVRAVSGEVLFAEDVIAEVRRIAIATPLAAGLLWRPGQSIEVEVAPRTWRRYFVAASNGAGRIELIVALTSGGPGAWWAATADGGDVAMLRGLRDERVVAIDAHRHVVAGDETAIGLCAALARWLVPDAVRGLVEVAPWAAWTRAASTTMPFTSVRRAFADPGRALALELVRDLRDDDAVYLAGSNALVACCRAALPAHARARVRVLATWAA